MKMRSLVFGIMITGVLSMLVWTCSRTFYFVPRQEMLHSISQTRQGIDENLEVLRNRSGLDNAFATLVDQTLGGTEEVVVHRLRNRLNVIGNAVELDQLNVSTGSAKGMKSPAERAFRRGPQALRQQLDFVTVAGDISGRGTLEQVVRLMEMLDDEPFVKRITRYSLNPMRNGELVDVSITLVTLFFPNHSPPELPAPNVSIGNEYAAIVAKNIFRSPPPPAPKPKAKPKTAKSTSKPKPKPKPTPPPPPYNDWVVTAIVRVGNSPEVWLQNKASNTSLHLKIGDSVLDAVLIKCEPEIAVIEINKKLYQVGIGQSLADRIEIESR